MMDQIPNKIPNNWTWTTLEDILQSLESGKRPKGGVRHIKEGIPSIGGEHLDSNGGFDFSNIKYVPIIFFNSMDKGIIQKEDVLVVKDGATTGKTSFVDANFPFEIAAVNEHVFILRPYSAEIFPKYLFYWMFSPYGQDCVKTNFQGSAQGGINSSFIKGSIFPLPPYNEQVRIVGRVEELFSRLDAGVRSLQAAQTQLKQYRQITLKQAYTGKLTLKWRQENFSLLSDVSEFLSSIREKRKKIMEKRKLIIQPIEEELESLPKEWKWVRAQDVCENITNGYTPKKDKLYEKGDIPFIKIYNMKKGECVDFNERPTFIDLETHNKELNRSKVYPNDILMNIVGPPLGKVSIVPADYPEWNINQAIVFYRPIEGYNLKFLFYCLQSEFILMHLRKQAKATAGQYNISVTMSRNLPIPLVPIEEQMEISKRLDNIFSYISRIESNIQKNIEMTDSFRSSVLKKAFEGKLIPQDSYDEPASILLERITSQRVNQRKLI